MHIFPIWQTAGQQNVTSGVTAFTRPNTIQEAGVTYAVDQPRTRDYSFTGQTSWSTITTFSGDIWATGVDFDNSTPLLATITSNNILRIYRNSVLQNTFGSAADFASGAVVNQTYRVRSVEIWHGAIIVTCQMTDLTDMQGLSVWVSQDYGATFAQIQDTNNLTDYPVMDDGGGRTSTGIGQGREWATSLFPRVSFENLTEACVIIADYQFKTDSPIGGQGWFLGMQRATSTGTWNFGRSRQVIEFFSDVGDTGLHLHTGGLCSIGVLWHFGDVGNRNMIRLAEFDTSFTNYETATVTDTLVFGGYDSTGTVYSDAPQPVAAKPAPTFGEHFASVDETFEFMQKFGDMSANTDNLQFSSVLWGTKNTTAGTSQEGWANLDLNYYYQKGWCQSNIEDLSCISRDGVNWAYIQEPGFGRMFFHGDTIVVQGTSTAWQSPIPTVETITATKLARSGSNAIATFTQQLGPNASNAVRRIFYDGTDWRYTSDSSLLPEQPPRPVGNDDVMAVEIEKLTTSTNRTCGRYYLQASGNSVDWTDAAAADVYIYSYPSNRAGTNFATRIQVLNSGFKSNAERGHRTADNINWQPFTHNTQSITNGNGRTAVQIFNARNSGTRNEVGNKVAINFVGINDADGPTPPLELGGTTGAETYTRTGMTMDTTWRFQVAAVWPENHNVRSTHLFELNDGGTNTLTVEKTSRDDMGSTLNATQQTGALELFKGVPYLIDIKCDGTDITVDCIGLYNQNSVTLTHSGGAFQPTTFIATETNMNLLYPAMNDKSHTGSAVRI